MINPLNKSLHRRALEQKLRGILPTLLGRVLDIGSQGRRYDSLLSSKPVAIDLVPNPVLDIAEGDVQALSFSDESFDSVMCLEVLEYIESPRKAATELYRVLASGGTLVVSTPFMMKTHDDRLRYTSKRLKELFETFSSLEIIPIGNFYSIILDIVRGKIMDRSLPLKLFLGLLWLPFLLLLPLAGISKDKRYVSGYLIVAKK